MGQVADGFTLGGLDEAHFGAIDVLRALASQLIAPQVFIPEAVNQITPVRFSIKSLDKGDILFRCRAKAVRLAFIRFEFGHVRQVAEAPPTQGHGHLVAEQAIVKGDAGDGLQLLASLSAPLVNHFELGAHQAAVPVFGVGADEFGPSDSKGNAPIRPGLRNQIQGRYNFPTVGIDHDGKISWVEGRVRFCHQVAGPGADPLIRLLLLDIPMNPAVKGHQSLGICWRGPAQNQAVSQIAQYGLVFSIYSMHV